MCQTPPDPAKPRSAGLARGSTFSRQRSALSNSDKVEDTSLADDDATVEGEEESEMNEEEELKTEEGEVELAKTPAVSLIPRPIRGPILGPAATVSVRAAATKRSKVSIVTRPKMSLSPRSRLTQGAARRQSSTPISAGGPQIPVSRSTQSAFNASPGRVATRIPGSLGSAPGPGSVIRQRSTQRRMMENQFLTKKRRFSALRKEISDKHKMLQQTREELIDMREQLGGAKSAAGGPDEFEQLFEPSFLEAVLEAATRVGLVPPSAARGVGAMSPVCDGSGESIAEKLQGPAAELVQWVEAKLAAVPEMCAERCREILNKRNEVLTWFMEIDSSRGLLDDEIRAKLGEYVKEGEASDAELQAWQNTHMTSATAAAAAVREVVSELERLRRELANATAQLQTGDASLTKKAQQAMEEAQKAMEEAQKAMEEAQQAKMEAQQAKKEAQQERGNARQAEAAAKRWEGEVAQLRTQAKQLEAQLGEAEARAAAAEHAPNEECARERERNKELSDNLAQLEVQLVSTHGRMRDAESKQTAYEARIQQLHQQMRIVEEQLRTQGVDKETQAKTVLKLQAEAQQAQTQVQEAQLQVQKAQQEAQQAQQEAQRSAQMLAELKQQRDALDLKVKELTQAMTLKDEESLTALSQMNEVQEELMKQLETEIDLKRKAEQALEEEQEQVLQLQERGSELEERVQELEELEERVRGLEKQARAQRDKQREGDAAAGLADELAAASERLKQAQAQLAAAKEKQRDAEKRSERLERERKALQDAIKKQEARAASEAEGREKAEALSESRMRELAEAREHARELAAGVEAMRQRLSALERKLADQRHKLNEAQRGAKQTAEEAQRVKQLQQEVSDLKAALGEMVRRSEEQEEALARRKVEAEQRERVMREQSKVLKVRDDLICLLKSKEARQNEELRQLQQSAHKAGHGQAGEVSLEEINKEAVQKADEMQGLYQAVEAKQMQVLRLEALVKQMEEQQERSQAQRTRQEARIANLEMLLMQQAQEAQTGLAAGAAAATAAAGSHHRQRYEDTIPSDALALPPIDCYYLEVSPDPRAQGEGAPHSGPKPLPNLGLPEGKASGEGGRGNKPDAKDVLEKVGKQIASSPSVAEYAATGPTPTSSTTETAPSAPDTFSDTGPDPLSKTLTLSSTTITSMSSVRPPQHRPGCVSPRYRSRSCSPGPNAYWNPVTTTESSATGNTAALRSPSTTESVGEEKTPLASPAGDRTEGTQEKEKRLLTVLLDYLSSWGQGVKAGKVGELVNNAMSVLPSPQPPPEEQALKIDAPPPAEKQDVAVSENLPHKLEETVPSSPASITCSSSSSLSPSTNDKDLSKPSLQRPPTSLNAGGFHLTAGAQVQRTPAIARTPYISEQSGDPAPGRPVTAKDQLTVTTPQAPGCDGSSKLLLPREDLIEAASAEQRRREEEEMRLLVAKFEKQREMEDRRWSVTYDSVTRANPLASRSTSFSIPAVDSEKGSRTTQNRDCLPFSISADFNKRKSKEGPGVKKEPGSRSQTSVAAVPGMPTGPSRVVHLNDTPQTYEFIRAEESLVFAQMDESIKLAKQKPSALYGDPRPPLGFTEVQLTERVLRITTSESEDDRDEEERGEKPESVGLGSGGRNFLEQSHSNKSTRSMEMPRWHLWTIPELSGESMAEDTPPRAQNSRSDMSGRSTAYGTVEKRPHSRSARYLAPLEQIVESSDQAARDASVSCIHVVVQQESPTENEGGAGMAAAAAVVAAAAGNARGSGEVGRGAFPTAPAGTRVQQTGTPRNTAQQQTKMWNEAQQSQVTSNQYYQQQLQGHSEGKRKIEAELQECLCNLQTHQQELSHLQNNQQQQMQGSKHSYQVPSELRQVQQQHEGQIKQDQRQYYQQCTQQPQAKQQPRQDSKAQQQNQQAQQPHNFQQQKQQFTQQQQQQTKGVRLASVYRIVEPLTQNSAPSDNPKPTSYRVCSTNVIRARDTPSPTQSLGSNQDQATSAYPCDTTSSGSESPRGRACGRHIPLHRSSKSVPRSPIFSRRHKQVSSSAASGSDGTRRDPWAHLGLTRAHSLPRYHHLPIADAPSDTPSDFSYPCPYEFALYGAEDSLDAAYFSPYQKPVLPHNYWSSSKRRCSLW